MRLLLVEDNDDLRYLFACALNRAGFEVRETAHGREALDSLADFLPDLVVTDLMMPVMGGLELIRRLRNLPAMAKVPIVAMTAAVTAQAVREARSAGAADLLAKPFDSRTLLERIVALTRPGRNPRR